MTKCPRKVSHGPAKCVAFCEKETVDKLFDECISGRDKEVLSQVNVGATIYATPVVANGTLYIASRAGWLWAVGQN